LKWTALHNQDGAIAVGFYIQAFLVVVFIHAGIVDRRTHAGGVGVIGGGCGACGEEQDEGEGAHGVPGIEGEENPLRSIVVEGLGGEFDGPFSVG